MGNVRFLGEHVFIMTMEFWERVAILMRRTGKSVFSKKMATMRSVLHTTLVLKHFSKRVIVMGCL